LRGTDDKNFNRKYAEDDVSEFSMHIFKINFFDKLKIKIFDVLNGPLIQGEISGKTEYRQKIIKILKIISDMDIKKPKITKINGESSGWKETCIENLSLSEYINSSLEYINEEHEGLNTNINTEFHTEINNIKIEHLIKNNIDKIKYKKEKLKKMLINNKRDELSKAYQFFSLDTESLRFLKDTTLEYIKENITEICKSSDNYKPALIEFKKKVDELILTCFNNDENLRNMTDAEFTNLLTD
jgi:hypothetical protein